MTGSELAYLWNGCDKNVTYLELFIVEEFLASEGKRSEFSEISLNIFSILRRSYADTRQIYKYMPS
jgi:hypothetical protein